MGLRRFSPLVPQAISAPLHYGPPARRPGHRCSRSREQHRQRSRLADGKRALQERNRIGCDAADELDSCNCKSCLDAIKRAARFDSEYISIAGDLGGFVKLSQLRETDGGVAARHNRSQRDQAKTLSRKIASEKLDIPGVGITEPRLI